MQTMKRLLAAALTLTTLIFSGCTAGPPQNSPGSTGSSPAAAGTNTGTSGKGRYVETEITPAQEELLDFLQNADGSLTTFSAGMTTRYDSKDNGKTWASSDGPGKNNPQLENARFVLAREDGGFLVSVSDATGIDHSLLLITPQGEVQPFPMAGTDAPGDTGGVSIHQLLSLAGNRFYIGGYQSEITDTADAGENAESAESNAEVAEGSLFSTHTGSEPKEISAVFDKTTGEKLFDVPLANAFSAAASDQSLYMADFNDRITTRSLTDGKEQKSTSLSQKSTEENHDISAMTFTMRALSALPDGALFSLTSKGLEKINPETGETETLMKGIGYSFGSVNSNISQLLALDSQSFLAVVSDAEGRTHFYHYTYDENATVDPDKVLNIWALRDNAIIRSAITEFMKANPDASINFEAALTEGSAQNANDAIQALNTKVLAGDGPDIMVLDGLPVESYVKKGMLTDLSDKLDLSDTYSEMIEPLKTDGKLYYLPARAKVSLLTGDAQTLAGMDSLENILSAIANGKDRPLMTPDDTDPFGALEKEERPAFDFTDLEELFPFLWNGSVNEIVKDGSIARENLERLLEAMKVISDKYKLAEDEGMSLGASVMMFGGSDAEAVTGNILSYMDNRSLAGLYTMGNLIYLQMAQTDNSAYHIFPGLSTGTYQPAAMAGINAKSGAQEFAADFIQSILSPESQSAMGSGFPVTRSGFAAQMKNLENLQISDNTGISTLDPLRFDMETFVKEMSTPVLADEFLSETVLSAATAYCKGETDMEAAIGKILTETKNYLAEQA